MLRQSAQAGFPVVVSRRAQLELSPFAPDLAHAGAASSPRSWCRAGSALSLPDSLQPGSSLPARALAYLGVAVLVTGSSRFGSLASLQSYAHLEPAPFASGMVRLGFLLLALDIAVLAGELSVRYFS